MKKTLCVLTALSLCASSCNKDGEIEGEAPGKVEVLEYRPAPGQFINEGMECHTQQEANAYAQKRIDEGLYVSLGAFGGYITVKMPKAVENRSGYDFAVAGNAFDGSSEPGIVWVSEDANGNGIADDPWYELRGSEEPTRDYRVTYTRPDEIGDIPWTDNRGNRGTVRYIPAQHTQCYYPEWIAEDSYTLSGSMLPPRSVQIGIAWKNESYPWGYADNLGTDIATKSDGRTYLYNQFDLEHAVDAAGNPVHLERIHFVRVQSAVLFNAGILGEVSTEVTGFRVF